MRVARPHHVSRITDQLLFPRRQRLPASLPLCAQSSTVPHHATFRLKSTRAGPSRKASRPLNSAPAGGDAASNATSTGAKQVAEPASIAGDVETSETDFQRFQRKFRAGNLAIGVFLIVVVGTILGAVLKTNRQESLREAAKAGAIEAEGGVELTEAKGGAQKDEKDSASPKKEVNRSGAVTSAERIAGLETQRKKLIVVRDDLRNSLERVEREIVEKAEKQAKRDEFRRASEIARGKSSEG